VRVERHAVPTVAAVAIARVPVPRGHRQPEGQLWAHQRGARPGDRAERGRIRLAAAIRGS
jgi:hypothetical protein